VYGVTLLTAVVLMAALWQYAVRAGLVRPDAADAEIRIMTTRLTPGLGGYVGLIILGFFVPTIAIVGYLGLALVLIVPFGLHRHKSSAR
jgi:hypothetical protein